MISKCLTLMEKRLMHFIKPHVGFVPVLSYREPLLRPLLRPPSLIPPLPPFTLPPRNIQKPLKYPIPAMLVRPPPPPRKLVKRHVNNYIEVNHQIYRRPQNLAFEICFYQCPCPLDYPYLLHHHLTDYVEMPYFCVHGLRLCYIDEFDRVCYLNHQNQRYLNPKTRREEALLARKTLLDDLEYFGISVEELCEIWHDNIQRDPVRFWVRQFLKHGYFALNDPMVNYCSTVGFECLPILYLFGLESSDGVGGQDDPNLLGRFLLGKGFRTNEYHLGRNLQDTLMGQIHMSPLSTKEAFTDVCEIFQSFDHFPSVIRLITPLLCNFPGVF